ncbi:SDR family NAD(P)-dependent oxidoreductase [Streptomyces sp. NPDC056486]|uniref:SDR family NAD(P)-dependent oxidoreductase n=1 Tax=Streptomyces sp. NPDC056486 TaxID=3345835 RepID=UPI0036AFABDD
MARETAEEITGAGGRAIAAPVDIADEDSVRSAIRRRLAEFRRLDVAVNNARRPLRVAGALAAVVAAPVARREEGGDRDHGGEREGDP